MTVGSYYRDASALTRVTRCNGVTIPTSDQRSAGVVVCRHSAIWPGVYGHHVMGLHMHSFEYIDF